MTFVEQINTEAAAIAGEIAAHKVAAMVYQADSKGRVALARGLPRDTYFDLPYEAWGQVWCSYCDEHGLQYYSGQP